MKELILKLNKIQGELNAPKNQRNNFGGYNYRSCEDILEAVKPLLKETGLVLTVSDEMVDVGGRIYVKATATITDGEHNISNSAFAREAEAKKGMDEAQITGSASSYARKYALNGLFCIDDNKDPDATNTHGKTEPKEEKQPSALDTYLEKARALYKYCKDAPAITLTDKKRVEIESALGFLRGYKSEKAQTAYQMLQEEYEAKAEQDQIVY